MTQKNYSKQISIIRNMLLLSLTITTNFTHPSYSSAGCFFASAVSSWYRESIAKSSITSSIAHATNTNAYDLADLITLGSLTWAISDLPVIKNPAVKSFLRRTALIAPIIMIITTSKSFNKYTHILFGCRHAKCKGICQTCKITQIYKALPFELITTYDFYQLLPLAAFNSLAYIGKYTGKLKTSYTSEQDVSAPESTSSSTPPATTTTTPTTSTNTPENTNSSTCVRTPPTQSINTAANRPAPTPVAPDSTQKQTDQSAYQFNINLLSHRARLFYQMLSFDAQTVFEEKSQDDCYLCYTDNAFQPICCNGHATCETCFLKLWKTWEDFGNERGYTGALPTCPECRADIFTL